MSETANINFKANYWNNESPNFTNILEDSDEPVINSIHTYYYDKEMTNLVELTS